MKFTTFSTIVLVTVALMPGDVRAQGEDQYAWGVAAGVAVATADLHDSHSNGASGTLLFGIGGVESPVGIRFDLMYNAFGDRDGGALDQGKARITAFTGNLVFNIYGDEKRLYGIAGIGGYSYNPDGAGAKSGTDFGVNGGLGLWLPGLRGFIEARFHNFYRALPDPGTGEAAKKSAAFVPITIGILF